MVRDTLTGSRIRERRLMIGYRQADLARKVGISASYLNLIEHNRRRIGGKLLVEIAAELGVEQTVLTEGAEAALISTLREAVNDLNTPNAELDRIDEFAGRFPGWAELLAMAQRRIGSLERTVETLSDRLTHDPNLADSLHEVLSTAAAIRSTASILAESQDIDPEWRERFHRNLNQDSARLSDSSKALVRYLDETEGTDAQERRTAPREDAEAMFFNHDFVFAELEDGSRTTQDIVDRAPELQSDAARSIALEFLRIYDSDAQKISLTQLQDLIASTQGDIAALIDALDVDIPTALRRIAAVPQDILGRAVGLVVCDASGAFLFRKPVDGFQLPQFGASCPLWPLFTALSRPMVPFRRRLRQFGRNTASFDCFAFAAPSRTMAFGSEPLIQSIMLIVPSEVDDDDPSTVLEVGTNCRVCQKHACPARREPSVLSDPF